MQAIHLRAVGGALLAVTALAPIASAEEAKTPVSASMILSIISRPVERRELAFDQALREDGPPPVSSTEGEVLPDGNVRYGRAIITVRNPCPPGTAHYLPPPLPGRRFRN